MISAKLYPGGVVNVSGVTYIKHDAYHKLIISKPDKKIADLHKSGYTNSVNCDSFEFKRETISNCIRLYGNFYRWLEFQLLHNRFVYDINQEFLLDTLWYIKTGERKMMLPVWESILNQYPDIGEPKPIRYNDSTIESFMNSPDNRINTFSNYIAEWTSHSDGIYDMLYTTYLLFGNADVSTLNKLKFNN